VIACLLMALALLAAPASKTAPAPRPTNWKGAPAPRVETAHGTPARRTTSASSPAQPSVAVTMTPADQVPSFWRTRAERTAYRTTGDYDEMMRYAHQLEAGSPWVRLVSFGTSGQGRSLPLLIVSKDRAFTPEAARATGKPIVLIQNDIHAGEIDGKDASLALVRDMTVLHRNEGLLDHVILLVIPVLSVDSHERRSANNRLNQNGPEEMGWRATPLGLNLNRDYVKAEAPEMRALLANVFTRWWPHLLMDNHTTDGADFRYDVTTLYNHGPGTPRALVRWLGDAIDDRVATRVEAMGHLVGPYMQAREGHTLQEGILAEDSNPRLSTGYAPLQGRPGLLVETHARKPYAVRVRACYDLMAVVLEEINAHPTELTEAVTDAENEIIQRGRESDPTRRDVVLSTSSTGDSTMFKFEGFATTWEPSPITGRLVPRYSATPKDTLIPLFRELEADVVVRQPTGYLVPQEWTTCREHLDLHGVHYRRFTQAWSDTVEQERVLQWSTGELSQGHHPTVVTNLAMVRRARTFHPGDLWVPLDQRSATVAVQLFESQAPDGLLRWNAFDTVFEAKEYAEDYMMDPIARRMLAADPALAREFAARLKSDSAFAANPRARVAFFYARSPWADPEQNLNPVARALRAPPASVLAP
jgi:murein tripeptide amidase MpaA